MDKKNSGHEAPQSKVGSEWKSPHEKKSAETAKPETVRRKEVATGCKSCGAAICKCE